MNVHHLELFYFVAKYEGITAAVRKMPYGIQQPAVSGQILQLENELGVKLFNRRPFALTPEGDELYDYIYPFFSRMAEVEQSIKGENTHHLRICASASVLRNHLPNVLEQLKLKCPELKLSLKEIEPSDIFTFLLQQQADIAISIVHGKLTDGLKAEKLLELPLCLLVPQTCKVKKLEDLLESDPEGNGYRAKIPLVGLPQNETLQQIFKDGLEKRNIKWDVSVEVNSVDVIKSYVSRGFGAGVGVSIPGVNDLDGCFAIPLTDFDPLVIGAVFQGTLKPIAEEFLATTKKYAKSI